MSHKESLDATFQDTERWSVAPGHDGLQIWNRGVQRVVRHSSQDFFRVKNIPSSASLSSWCLALRATDPSGGGSRGGGSRGSGGGEDMRDDCRGLNEDTKKPLSAPSSSVPCYTYRRLGTVLQAHDGKKGWKGIPAEEKAGKGSRLRGPPAKEQEGWRGRPRHSQTHRCFRGGVCGYI